MEVITQEATSVENAGSVNVESTYRELSEIELALIGGGHGDITLG